MIGKIMVFKDSGFGFIRYTVYSDTKEVYFHIKNYSNQNDSIPVVGEHVNFELGPSLKPGKMQAVGVRRIEPVSSSVADLLSDKSGEAVQS
jgi:cold shock CspA family protein